MTRLEIGDTVSECPDCEGTGETWFDYSGRGRSFDQSGGDGEWVDCETCRGTGYLHSSRMERVIAERGSNLSGLPLFTQGN